MTRAIYSNASDANSSIPWFSEWSRRYVGDLSAWLQANCLPEHFRHEQLEAAAMGRLRELKIEAPRPAALERIINSALNKWEQGFFKRISEVLSQKAKTAIDQILARDEHHDNNDEKSGCSFRILKSDPGRISIDTIAGEIKKLETIRQVTLPQELLRGLPYNFLKRYRDRMITEPAREGRRHPAHIRYALMAVFLYLRGREITDDLVELLIRTVKRIGAQAEANVEKAYIAEVKKVRHKNVLLYKMASAVWDQPDAPARETVFPVVGEKTIRNIIREYKYSGSEYTLKVNLRMRASYRTHYRRMLPRILETLEGLIPTKVRKLS
jgi:hypothetical protein